MLLVERTLRERMRIPVFHDDQHGTAIIDAYAITNGLKVVGKKIESATLVRSGAGAAVLARLDLLVSIGMPMKNIAATDIKGSRTRAEPRKRTITRRATRKTPKRASLPRL